MNSRDVIRYITDQDKEITNLREVIRENVISPEDLYTLKNWHSEHSYGTSGIHVFSVEFSWTTKSIVKIGKCSCGACCDLSQLRNS